MSTENLDIELYGVLGLQSTASDDEVKVAFRKLALELHPDKNRNHVAEDSAEFHRVAQA